MNATDEYGLCVKCGGHGSVMTKPTTPDGKWGAKDCDWCDGHDHVTPMAEAQAEAYYEGGY